MEDKPDKDKDFRRPVQGGQGLQHDEDSSTVEKKKGSQGKADSKEQDPEAAPTTSVYQGGRWTPQPCSINPPTPTQPTPQMQDWKAREAAAHQVAAQLLAEEDMAAAKAAARKAKKSRQQLKKQHAEGSQHGMKKTSQPGFEAADAQSLEPTIQYSTPRQQGVQNAATSYLHSQASAGEETSAESTSTQSSADPGLAFKSLFLEEIEHQISPVGPLLSPMSLVQTQTAQSPKYPGLTKGSPSEIHRLLCCPLTKVALTICLKYSAQAFHCNLKACNFMWHLSAALGVPGCFAFTSVSTQVFRAPRTE